MAKRVTRKKKKQKGENPGFNQYKVTWSGVNFTLMVEGVKFYGWRRITSSPQDGKFWAVDVFAKWDNHTFAVKSVPYLDSDPFKDKYSLNADLCAIANEWWYQRCQGNHDTLADLVKKSKEPVITFRTLASVDAAIASFKRHRDEAILSGHHRFVGIKSDGEHDPRVTIQLNLRKDAVQFQKSRVAPPLQITAPTASHDEETEDITGIEDEVKSLLDQLERTKNKGQGRKLRAALRKLGYHGGAKAIRERIKSEKREATEPARPDWDVYGDGHDWEKISLVTEKGGYDKMKCRRCGAEGKRYGLGQSGVKVNRKSQQKCKVPTESKKPKAKKAAKRKATKPHQAARSGKRAKTTPSRSKPGSRAPKKRKK